MAEHPNLASALVAALADLTVVEKGRTANAGSYSYEYADIGDVVKRTRPVLAEHGVVALTPVHDHGNGLACTVTFLHTSGDRLDFGPFPFPHGRDAQATGSMVTYHRRYALVAALGMAAGDDDDGAAAKPAAPAWNARMAKADLLNKLGGNKDEAAAAWEYGSGDSWGTYDAAAVDELVARWRAREVEGGGGSGAELATDSTPDTASSPETKEAAK